MNVRILSLVPVFSYVLECSYTGLPDMSYPPATPVFPLNVRILVFFLQTFSTPGTVGSLSTLLFPRSYNVEILLASGTYRKLSLNPPSGSQPKSQSKLQIGLVGHVNKITNRYQLMGSNGSSQIGYTASGKHHSFLGYFVSDRGIRGRWPDGGFNEILGYLSSKRESRLSRNPAGSPHGSRYPCVTYLAGLPILSADSRVFLAAGYFFSHHAWEIVWYRAV